MEGLALIMTAVGLVLSLVGGVWMLIAAFRTSILWGLGIILIPLIVIIYVIGHWEDAANPFLLSVLGWALVGAAATLL